MWSETTSPRGPVALCAAAVLLAVTGCERALSTDSFSGSTMGTSYDVIVETEGPGDTARVALLVGEELMRLDGVLSTYDPASDVSRFNDYDGSEAFQVDEALVAVVSAALEVSRRSSGVFDPTVGPLVDAWGFGPEDAALPDSATVRALMERVGHERLEVDAAARTLTKADAGVRIDLSGIAKGFAAERIVGTLAALGYESALVDIGGELRVLGAHADGRPWRVAVEGPGRTPTVIGTVALVDEAIATSGDFRNYFEDDGVLYTHLIDPRTGFPIPFRGFSVSVVHADATMADAWATALTVLGPEEGFELAERESLAAVFALLGPDGMLTRATTAMGGRITPVDRSARAPTAPT